MQTLETYALKKHNVLKTQVYNNCKMLSITFFNGNLHHLIFKGLLLNAQQFRLV